MSGSLYLWCQEQGPVVWQKMGIMSWANFFCSSLVKSKPTWLCSKELIFKHHRCRTCVWWKTSSCEKQWKLCFYPWSATLSPISTYCFFEAELVLSSAIQGPTASLRLNWSSLLPYKDQLLLWGWTGPLFCHTRTYCFFEAELVLSSAIQGPTASLRLNWSSLLPYKDLLLLWGWTGPLFCHTRTYCFFEAELVLSSAIQVPTVSLRLNWSSLLSHKDLLFLWGWTGPLFCCASNYCFCGLLGKVLPPVPQVLTASLRMNCLILSSVPQVPAASLRWTAWTGTASCPTCTYCFSEVEPVLSSVTQVPTVSVNCLDRYCLQSHKIFTASLRWTAWSFLLLHKYLLFLGTAWSFLLFHKYLRLLWCWTAWKGTASCRAPSLDPRSCHGCLRSPPSACGAGCLAHRYS